MAVADVVLGIADPDMSLRASVADEFPPEELAELVVTVAMAVGFSKSAIAWGPEPRLPTTEVPTPGS